MGLSNIFNYLFIISKLTSNMEKNLSDIKEKMSIIREKTSIIGQKMSIIVPGVQHPLPFV
ncbi:hypothetical protein [Caldibacillus debilis]|uniref:hypothetical protein n=1 Tax=Caldibacillus debilis TaxID=301148 RepID=UPI000E377F37|nr:hypothetical protein [Caldibacillus debilis]REJ27365.1 MAG: hypothetical protein C6W56_10570 [Caldibacillus debilis]